MGTLLIDWDLKPSPALGCNFHAMFVTHLAAKLGWMALQALTQQLSCQTGAVQQHTTVDGNSQLLSQCTADSQIIKIEAA